MKAPHARVRGAASQAPSAIAAVGLPGICALLMVMHGVANDTEDAATSRHERPPYGTPFVFAVIESFNAKYEGDTPGHIGRGGGVTLHPDVALGDPVYQRIGVADTTIGVITGVKWDRLRGSLVVEFHPKEDRRIAVGDEVWVDLNPAPRTDQTRSADGNRAESH